MTTGQRIREARKKAGLTQAQLAEKLGIPFQSISQWERDLRKPKWETLVKIADALEIRWQYFWGYEDIDGYLLPAGFADPEDYKTLINLGYGDLEFRESHKPQPLPIELKAMNEIMNLSGNVLEKVQGKYYFSGQDGLFLLKESELANLFNRIAESVATVCADIERERHKHRVKIEHVKTYDEVFTEERKRIEELFAAKEKASPVAGEAEGED